MSKHTPGPWKVINGTVYIGLAKEAECSPDKRAWEKRECIAKMHRDPSCAITPTERDANARLIAMAPELLWNLKDMQARWFMEHGSENEPYKRMKDVIDRADPKL